MYKKELLKPRQELLLKISFMSLRNKKAKTPKKSFQTDSSNVNLRCWLCFSNKLIAFGHYTHTDIGTRHVYFAFSKEDCFACVSKTNRTA
jgi:hypothetical protein